ncbi:putative peptidase [Thalassovita gelatinovora]|uniref:Putative peptidase n=1 Tax=Thalassovita gelatinovora TaxID=53501 RepID=A0A0P1F8M9_THAGE|nr:M23 family metallopeptidase [Thalassovita gelatinovora]QIZ81353.1 M23 family metallopeptidase [Thalassovita gelatinovora]CUH64457.1 putative peptidase [Thalassovita gelatinovora]SEP98354.1 Peptidase family M23 [Thalassovita gelatinovora]
MKLFGFFLGFALAAQSAAGAPLFQWPVDCTLGDSCYIEDYVDHDPAAHNIRDFSCGINTRDAHKGTDIALLSFDEIDAGITVRAAAFGRVERIRDSMADDRLMRGVTKENACGNAVLMTHGDGWQTLYCHMKLSSVLVKPGDVLQPGDALGQIGLSGQTNHPHLHFQVIKDGKIVDPFDAATTESCADPVESLWDDPVEYYRTGLVTAGFANKIPSIQEVQSGAVRLQSSAADDPLVVYSLSGDAQAGDLLTIWANGPQGEVFRKQIPMENPQRAVMRAVGRKAPAGGWPQGAYVGEAQLTRNGTIIAHRFAHVTVE